MAVLRPHFLPLCLGLLLLAACRSETDPDAAPAANAATAPDAAPPGEVVSPAQGEKFELGWFGVLPCADCDGIQSRLTLSFDGERRHYVLEEVYLGGDSEGENRYVQEGDWVEEVGQLGPDPAVVYRLDPQGAGRWYWLQPDGALEMLDGKDRPTANGIDYRLQRM